MSERFAPKEYAVSLEEGEVCWQAPSNIALIKYWGKKEVQIPRNPSLSFTLSACATRTSVRFSERKDHDSDYSIDFYFEGERKEDFLPKINTFFKRAEPYLSFLRSYHFVIRSENTFPHSSGIASSASSMAALALCLLDIERQLLKLSEKELDLNKASFIARLGSGSASRSVHGKIVEWGLHKDTPGSSDLFGIPWENDVHDIFTSYHDTILL
ncbi:MAG: diphosphomevalonate decarboxylase, partial [Eudoraea sp.]|nr:diphosphomevalonate decarboxylase [Eudoraea sp.]